MRLVEMDCSSRKFRYLSVTEYEEETGKVLAKNGPTTHPGLSFLSIHSWQVFMTISVLRKNSRKSRLFIKTVLDF